MEWSIATDPEMTAFVAGGTTETTPLRDYTVKVDATGLQPGTIYYLW